MDQAARQLAQILPDRPGLRDHWEFMYNKDAVCIKRADKVYFYKDPFDWCVHHLMGDPFGELHMDYGMLLEILDEYLSKGSKMERARLDDLLYNHLSDFAAIHEMNSMINLHRPRVPRLPHPFFEREEKEEPGDT